MKHIVALLTGLLLASLTAVHAADVAPTPFFAMDTAVQNLNKLPAVKQFGYAGIGWKPGPPEALAATVQQLHASELKLFAIYAGGTLTKTGLTWSPEIEADIAVLEGTDAIIWLPIFSKEFACSAAEGDAIAVPALERLADRAAAHGVRVAFIPTRVPGPNASRMRCALNWPARFWHQPPCRGESASLDTGLEGIEPRATLTETTPRCRVYPLPLQETAVFSVQ